MDAAAHGAAAVRSEAEDERRSREQSLRAASARFRVLVLTPSCRRCAMDFCKDPMCTCFSSRSPIKASSCFKCSASSPMRRLVIVLQVFRRLRPERAQLAARAIELGLAKLDQALREILLGVPEIACASAFANAHSSELLIDVQIPPRFVRPDVLWFPIAFPFQIEPRGARCGSYSRRPRNRGQAGRRRSPARRSGSRRGADEPRD